MSPDPLAVLTGDFVGSSRLGGTSLDAAMATLAEAAETAADWAGNARAARFTRFRGDGWQCLAPSPELSLRVMLYLRARLRALGAEFDTRISAGVGPGTLPASDLSAGTGQAFELSGHGLDSLGRAARLGIAWPGGPVGPAALDALVATCDEISRRWTPRQARVVALRLQPDAPSQSEIGGRFGISQQMVAKHLQTGGDWALRRALAALEGGTSHDE
jgi:hypothetical protein